MLHVHAPVCEALGRKLQKLLYNILSNLYSQIILIQLKLVLISTCNHLYNTVHFKNVSIRSTHLFDQSRGSSDGRLKTSSLLPTHNAWSLASADHSLWPNLLGLKNHLKCTRSGQPTWFDHFPSLNKVDTFNVLQKHIRTRKNIWDSKSEGVTQSKDTFKWKLTTLKQVNLFI